MGNSLQDYRRYAADCSGGTSPHIIKSLILKIIRTNKIKGDALDYGAGIGELLTLLNTKKYFRSLSGADILERPPHLPEEISWHQGDLNYPLECNKTFDLVIFSETIEHLENPRAAFRNIHQLVSPGGYLLLTMPNQESIRALVGLIIGGHFAMFLGNSYPAHITALLRLDLQRICQETGFEEPTFYYTDRGGIPKMPHITWQRVTFKLLKGRLFSDNVAMLVRRKD